MIIYFYTQTKNEISRAIIQYFRKAEVDVFSNLENNKTGNIALSQADALVVYDKSLAKDCGYFVALAISENKPILFLTDEKGVKSKTLLTLSEDKNFKNKVDLVACDVKNLADILLKFLRKLDQNSGRDIINIKYTLRVSAIMSAYLTWQSQSTAMPKADWIRNLIAEKCKNDKDYQNFLNQKYKTQ